MHGMTTPQRSGVPFDPRLLSLALSLTNQKSIVGQYMGRGLGPERSRKGEMPMAARKPQGRQ